MWFKNIISQFFEDIKYKWRHYKDNTYSPQIEALKNPYRSCFDHCTCWFLHNIDKRFLSLEPEDVTIALQSENYRQWVMRNMGMDIYNRYKSNLSVLWNLQLKYIRDQLKKYGIKKQVKINYNTSEKELLDNIEKGTIIINTMPKHRGRRLGHVMLIVGHGPKYWEIDDPFGLYNFKEQRYENHLYGDNILASRHDLEKCRGKLSISIA